MNVRQIGSVVEPCPGYQRIGSRIVAERADGGLENTISESGRGGIDPKPIAGKRGGIANAVGLQLISQKITML